ncbi:MAG: TRAP transporter substrate-binding protein DctP [Deltaproteobacteria bacterium]|nr:TRAP transporter substrate-binding protein DctP [Deltaproteobacteria bacterium]
MKQLKMNILPKIFWILVNIIIVFTTTPNAKAVTIKLGTLAPEGSGWHRQLKDMAVKWAKASNNQVQLKIFPSGVAGNEGDMVRKMRIGQLQAAAISTIGVGEIDSAPKVLSIPGLIASDAEYEYVFNHLVQKWEQRLVEKGFQALMWGDTGSARFFLRKSITSPNQLQDMKIFVWAGDPKAVEVFKLAGFQPVVLSVTDLMTSLATGMIDAYNATPVMALATRWYERTPFMTAAAWAHLPGTTLITTRAWNKIPKDLQPELLRISRAVGVQVNEEVARMQADAIAGMKKNGLKIIEFDTAGMQAWQELAQKTWPAIRGGAVSVADFDEAKRIRDEFRANKH